jgi:hypothetical protein
MKGERNDVCRTSSGDVPRFNLPSSVLELGSSLLTSHAVAGRQRPAFFRAGTLRSRSGRAGYPGEMTYRLLL